MKKIPEEFCLQCKLAFFFFPPNTFLSGTYEHTEKRHLLFWLPSITSPWVCPSPRPLRWTGDSEGQGGLACCSPWGFEELDMTWLLNNNNKASLHPSGNMTSIFLWELPSSMGSPHLLSSRWPCDSSLTNQVISALWQQWLVQGCAQSAIWANENQPWTCVQTVVQESSVFFLLDLEL